MVALNENGAKIGSTIYLQFEVHFIVPRMRVKFTGQSDVLVLSSTHSVALNRIKANKLGEYSVEVQMLEGVKAMECQIDVRGKLNVFPENIKLYEKEKQKISLRQKNVRNS